MGHFPNSAEKSDNYGEIIDQTTDAGLEKIILIIFIFLNCSVLVSSGIHQSRVAISKMFFIKVLTIMTLVQIVEACQNLSHLRPLFFKPSKLANFIAKFSINLEFCYKSVLGLS